MQRLYNGVRLLDGVGPCLQNAERIDLGALPMIIRMAQTGLQVDLTHFSKLEKRLVTEMDKLDAEVTRLTGYTINLNSPDQKADLLFKKLGLKQARPKMTRSGDRESVEDEVLTAIQHDHPVVPVLQDFAELSKLLGTYVRPMPKLARRVGFGHWRMYPNFKTTRVPSSRLACSDPNLLAMPNRTAMGREIRKGFITRPGWVLVSVDESQIEVRLAAHCSKDRNLIRIYHNEEDIYSDFATAAFKLEDKRYRSDSGKWIYPTVDPHEHRFPSKTCVLASIYEVSSGGLSEQMPVVCANCNKPTRCLKCASGVEHSEHVQHDCGKYRPLWHEDRCQQLLNSFYIQYAGVLANRLEYHRYAMRHGFIVDIWGRLLHVQAVRSVHPWVVSAALREVSNFPFQSGAQGTIKLTMASTYDALEAGHMWDVVHPLLQVHDELLYECRKDVAEELIALTRYEFENCVRFDVPIKASGSIAETWGTLEK
jgi:DNA polymerase I